MDSTDGAGPTAPQVAGYRVEELVGVGACGEVWRARDVATGRLVALKVLRHDGPPSERDRLRREAAVLAGLSSPHIVRLVTVVTAARGLVLVLEYQGGGSLAALLRTRPRLSPGEVVTIAAPLAAALAEVHAGGVVHGDISPANLLFALDGRPVLSDLGVSRLAGRAGADAVTAAYADPAVLEGAPLTPASDVYALAAVCFEALTGRPPYLGADPESVLLSAESPRPLLVELVPDAPAMLVEAVESALAVDADHRLDAAAFAAALLDSCEALPVRLAGATVPVASAATANVRRLPPPPVVVETGPSRWERLERRLRRVRVSPRRLVGAAAVPLAVAAAIWGGVAWARSSADQGSRPAAWAVPAVPSQSARGAATHVLSTHVVQSYPGPSATTRPTTAPTTAIPTTAIPTPRAAVLTPPAVATTAPAAATTAPAAATTAPAAAATPATPPAATPATPPAVVDLLPVVAALDAERDGAFVKGDPTLLESVYAPGSPPLEADQARLLAMVQAGERAHGLALRVRTVHLVTRTATSATVRVADELGPYSLVSPEGQVLHALPARGLTTWTMSLVREGSGEAPWRIAAISRA